MTKVYREGTPALQMSIDGWSRAFEVSQTLEEMRAMGVEITEEQIRAHWKVIDKGYEELCKKDSNHKQTTTN